MKIKEEMQRRSKKKKAEVEHCSKKKKAETEVEKKDKTCFWKLKWLGSVRISVNIPRFIINTFCKYNNCLPN